MLNTLRRLWKHSGGTAAIEFALVMPMMFAVMFGIYELGAFVRVNMKVANAATSIADLVSQQAAGATGGTSGTFGNFCTAGKLTMSPYATNSTSGAGTFSAAIASVTNYTSTGATVDWESDASCAVTASSLGSTAKTLATTPTNVIPTAGTPGDSVIVVKVTYQYGSAISYLFPALTTLTQVAYARPRNNQTITCTAPCS
ncbi:TadE/TadG family type IV pilus assembly protein [Paraburkholderia phosphatilytica]|uniref:TadE/TadG family type IV pilus assembly protein n=1 Tax=Paraburkholderia phosphatilytica TaxID=2282883 RepID=UPI000E4CEB28|nr:TadE/TadG family type IV pilus assembly protein [Paraburkholderia phosphatilytica]